MITAEPTAAQLAAWKQTWLDRRGQLTPNRITGAALLGYLCGRYVLTPLHGAEAEQAVAAAVLENEVYAQKLPAGAQPEPRVFYLENAGAGRRFFSPEHRDPAPLWGGRITRIFVGIDVTTGYFTVEGSTLLWDELCAVRGFDAQDLRNFVCTAQYLEARRRCGLAEPR